MLTFVLTVGSFVQVISKPANNYYSERTISGGLLSGGLFQRGPDDGFSITAGRSVTNIKSMLITASLSIIFYNDKKTFNRSIEY